MLAAGVGSGEHRMAGRPTSGRRSVTACADGQLESGRPGDHTGGGHVLGDLSCEDRCGELRRTERADLHLRLGCQTVERTGTFACALRKVDDQLALAALADLAHPLSNDLVAHDGQLRVSPRCVLDVVVCGIRCRCEFCDSV